MCRRHWPAPRSIQGGTLRPRHLSQTRSRASRRAPRRGRARFGCRSWAGLHFENTLMSQLWSKCSVRNIVISSISGCSGCSGSSGNSGLGSIRSSSGSSSSLSGSGSDGCRSDSGSCMRLHMSVRRPVVQAATAAVLHSLAHGYRGLFLVCVHEGQPFQRRAACAECLKLVNMHTMFRLAAHSTRTG